MHKRSDTFEVQHREESPFIKCDGDDVVSPSPFDDMEYKALCYIPIPLKGSTQVSNATFSSGHSFAASSKGRPCSVA